MATFDAYNLEASRLSRENLSSVAADLLASAKTDLKRYLWPHLEAMIVYEGVTETAFYDEIVTDLSSGHEVLEELQELLAFSYLTVYFSGRFAAVQNADWDRMMIYKGYLASSNLKRFAGLVQKALDEQEIDFETADVTRAQETTRTVFVL